MRASPRIVAALVLGLLACGLGTGRAWAEPSPSVSASFVGAPPVVYLGVHVDLVLRVTASRAADEVHVEVLPSSDLQVVGGVPDWTGPLAPDQVLDLPISVQLSGSGEYVLGARVTSRIGATIEVTGATLSVTAAGGVARLDRRSHTGLALGRAVGPAQQLALGLAEESPGSPGAPAGPAEVTGTVRGTVRYTDPEGHTHLVRHAFVQVVDGDTDVLLANTATDANGVYAATVTATRVTVRVYSRDVDLFRVVVFPPGQPTFRYILQRGPATLTGQLTLDITSARPVRGSPGNPSVDGPGHLAARAFQVYDAMLTYWFQATALLGRNMQVALTNFPHTGGTVSFYQPSTQQMFITRERAFVWDVLGHEFFHFTTDVFSRSGGRSIDNNPGGSHTGGSAIGQSPGSGLPPRNRDQGMRLAWSEGLATFMSLALQSRPASAFPFPTGVLNVGDTHYTTAENFILDVDAETPVPSDGFGSEYSVLGVLWDISDSLQDASGTARDTFSGGTPKIVWDAITSFLPCSPCNRVDRLWGAIVDGFGFNNGATLSLAKLFALNNVAPEVTGPADGGGLAGGLRPTFQWIPNGDPSPNHRNDTFMLAFSRDGFQSHLVLIDVPGTGATSYQPTEAEWNQVLLGGQTGAEYQWLVVAQSSPFGAGNPLVPEGGVGFWYSQIQRFTVRSLHVRITWNRLGADVDLHVRAPSGQEIYYGNRTLPWGVLDRDCITTCTEENISVSYLPETGVYRVYAHYYSDHGLGPATVRAEVFNAGVRVLDTTFGLSDGQSRDIVVVQLPASGEAQAVPATAGPRPLSRAVWPPKPASGP